MTDHDELCPAPGSAMYMCICSEIRNIRADERRKVDAALAEARQNTPPFLGMDSFHLLAWMHEGPSAEDRARPADALIREVWKSAHDAVMDEVRKMTHE